MDRAGLPKRLDTASGAFQDSYVGLSAPEMMEPGVTGDWSMRDILAHVATWEEEALKCLPSPAARYHADAIRRWRGQRPVG